MRRSVCVLAVLASAGSSACDSQPSLTTSTRSENLPTPEARVAFLGKYLRLRSPVEDAAFAVDYHDNSAGLIAGPSDWNIRAALRLSPASMPAWLEKTTPCVQPLPPGIDPIVPAAWRVASPARCLTRDGSTLLVHDAESVLVFFSAAR